jgi:uncharacterized protein
MEARLEKIAVIEKLRTYFFAREEVIVACVHGSFTGDGRYNDIDVALLLARAPESALDYELEIETALSLQRAYPREVDVRLLNGAPVGFQYGVIKKNIMLFVRDEDAYADFKEIVIRRYLGFKHHRDQMLKEAFNL